MGTEEGGVMDDAAAGCFAVIVVGLVVATFVIITLVSDDANADGYRRGLCEGRGGVEATVGDSIRCIRPPVAVDTARGR
jgi:hypothetical protein